MRDCRADRRINCGPVAGHTQPDSQHKIQRQTRGQANQFTSSVGGGKDSLCRVRALCPRFVLRKKLGSGPLLRALPRDPGQPRRASLDLKRV